MLNEAFSGFILIKPSLESTPLRLQVHVSTIPLSKQPDWLKLFGKPRLAHFFALKENTNQFHRSVKQGMSVSSRVFLCGWPDGIAELTGSCYDMLTQCRTHAGMCVHMLFTNVFFSLSPWINRISLLGNLTVREAALWHTLNAWSSFGNSWVSTLKVNYYLKSCFFLYAFFRHLLD